MQEMVKLQRLMVMPTVRNIIENTLDKPEKMHVYEMTDGIMIREEIISTTGVSAGAISGWWNDWLSKGILEKDGSKYKKIFSLKDLGISVPALKDKKKDQDPTNQEQENG